MLFQPLLPNRQIPCGNKGDAAEPRKWPPVPCSKLAHIWDVYRWRIRGPSSWLGALLSRPCCVLLQTDGWAWRLYPPSVRGLFQLIFPLLISAREDISGCCCPRQSHQLGGHDYQSWSVLQMGKGEQLIPPSPAFSGADVALSSPLRLHCRTVKRKRNAGHPVTAWPLLSSPYLRKTKVLTMPTTSA